MKSTFGNIFYKAFQSIIGFSLLAIQSRFLVQEDLAIFAIAQSLLVIVALFDFGIGVNLTTWIVKSFDKNSVEIQNRNFVSRALIISKRKQIFAAAFVQSIFFGTVFFFLVRTFPGEKTLIISCLFAVTVFMHSVGLNFGRLFLTTGDIALLVKLQLIGAIIAFLATILGLKSSYNLNVSILAMSFSSAFLGICALKINKNHNEISEIDINKYSLSSGKTEAEKMTYIQIGQLLQISLPLMVQFILVSSFNPGVIVVYSVCQKFVSSIGNIFGSEIQLNFSAEGTAKNIVFNDIAKFYRNYLGYLILSSFVSIVSWFIWEDLYSNIGKPSIVTLLSFIPIGLLVLIDQALRYRLYFLLKFRLEMIASFIYIAFFLMIFQFSLASSILLLNLFLMLPYIPKWIALFASRKYFQE
jgi:hypothetical protein